MPITSSAKKAHRVSQRKRVFNDRRRKAMREAVKEVKKLTSEKSAKEAEALLPKVYKTIDKAVKKGIIKKNTAARKKSRIVKAIANAS